MVMASSCSPLDLTFSATTLARLTSGGYESQKVPWTGTAGRRKLDSLLSGESAACPTKNPNPFLNSATRVSLNGSGRGAVSVLADRPCTLHANAEITSTTIHECRMIRPPWKSGRLSSRSTETRSAP